MKLVACMTACLMLTACLALPGCLWANKNSDSMTGFEARAMLGTSGGIEGADVHAVGGYAGLYADVEANLRDADRPDDLRTYKALGVGFSTRASLFGILGDEHRLERYFDFGAMAGVGAGGVLGVPPHSIAGMGSAWFGAWVDIGTFSIGDRYLALTGGIRREAFTEPWNDRTQLMIGLALRKREPVTDRDLTWRD